jgi:aryl-alcohol dehydrogenase-like predicted oxidoreductase
VGHHEVPAAGRSPWLAAGGVDPEPYNLLNRSFEVGLAEVAIREQCGLLAYSPLAFGMLSGKYENGARRKTPA